MGFWRPSKSCLFVIPDIHGMHDQLQLILNRILPLRNTKNSKDHLVFLGDYMDRRVMSPETLDLVIEAKEDHPDQVTCLMGNHELLLLNAIKPEADVDEYLMWMKNGGAETLQGYLKRAGSDMQPYDVLRRDVHRFIPKEHLSFLESLENYYETDEYIFVHGGCDPYCALDFQPQKLLAWDRSVYSNMKIAKAYQAKCDWEKIIVTGHNGEYHGNAFIYDKFMMLDGSYKDKINVMEMNSRELFSARKGKKRLVKEPIT